MSPTSYQAAPPRGRGVPDRSTGSKGLPSVRPSSPRPGPRLGVSASPPLKPAAARANMTSTVNAPPRPPPLPPPRSRAQPAAPPVRAPLPSDEGVMSTRAKLSLADIALQLRDEQLQARVIHYKADLETSPELDAITAQVVAELHAMQAAAARAISTAPPAMEDRAQVEIELIGALKRELGRLFRPGDLSNVISRKIAEANKRFARLFFESELCERIRGTAGEQKTMRFASQALYHVLS